MESLYVCLFSNGHIKVGRSIDPYSRAAAHADRVSCVGVELVKTHSTEAIDAADRRESILIGLCANSPGATRFKSEWFSGLEYDMVCIWADQLAARELEEVVTLGSRLSAARLAAGKTQGEVGDVAGVSGAAVSAWEVNRTQPSATQLAAVCDLLGVSADKLLGRKPAKAS